MNGNAYGYSLVVGVADLENVRRKRLGAIFAAALLLVCMTNWFAFEIPRGILNRPDEMLTAERTREMVLTGQLSVVHFNFSPSFEKPPLQYWFSSLTLIAFNNKAVALRIWSMTYALLTALVTGWLAFLIAPSRPWLIPASIAMLFCHPRFPLLATGAWLDMGLAFFTTIAVAFTLLAQKDPRWWVGTAMACILASLQKAPISLWVVGSIVLARCCSPNERQLLRNKWFIGSGVLAACGMSAWWILQVVRYEMPVGKTLRTEVIDWAGPSFFASQVTHLPLWYNTVFLGWVSGGIFAWAAILAVLLWKQQRFSTATKEIALAGIAFILLMIASGFHSVRYILPIVPCLALTMAIVLHRVLESPGLSRCLGIIVGLIVLLGGLVQARNLMGLTDKHAADSKRVAEELGARQTENAGMLLVADSIPDSSRARPPDSFRLYTGFYLFHGNLRYALSRYLIDELAQVRPVPPLLGVCIDLDFPAIQEVYPRAEKQFTQGEFVLWRVD